MKNMTKLSKIVAVFCVAVLLVNSVDLSAFTAAAADTDSTAGAVKEDIEEYTILGVEDFTGQDEITYTDESTSVKPSAGDQSLDGMLVDGVYLFSGEATLYIGAANWGGFRIGRKGTTDVMTYQFMNNAGAQSLHYKEITADDTGCKLFDEEVRIKVGVFFVKTYEDTAVVDAKIVLNIGDTYEDVFVLEGVQKSHLIGRMYAYPNGGSITMKAADRQELLDFSDFGVTEDYTVADGTVVKSAGSGTMDGVTIDGTYNLSGYPSIQFGERDGMRLQIHVGGGSRPLVCQFLDSSQVSHTPTTGGTHTTTSLGCNYLNTDVRIKVGFSFANVDETAKTADITIKLQIGPTWTDTIQIDGATNIDKLTRTLVLIGSSSTGSSITLKAPKPEGVEMTPADMGIVDGVYGYQEGVKPEEDTTVLGIDDFLGGETQKSWTGTNSELLTAGEGTLDGVTIDGIFNISRYSSIAIGSQAGYRLMIGVNNNYLFYYQFANASGIVPGGEAKTFDATALGCAFNGQDVRIKASFEFTNQNEATGLADVTIRLQIGESLEEQVLTFSNVIMSQMGKNIFVNPNTGAVTLKVVPEEKNELGIADFIGGETQKSWTGTNSELLTAGTGTLDGVTIDGIFNISRYSSIAIGSQAGYRLMIGVNNNYLFYYQFANASGIVPGGEAKTFDATALGCAFNGQDVRIKASFEFTNQNEATGLADVTIRLQIGESLEEQVLTFSNVIMSQMGKNIFINPNTGAVTLKVVPEEKNELGIADFIGGETEKSWTGTNSELLTAGTGTLDGVTIDGIFNISRYSSIAIGSQAGYRLMIGVNNNYLFYYQFANASGIVAGGETKTFDANTLGCAYNGQDVRIKASFEFANQNSTTGLADVTIRLQIGETLEEQVINISNAIMAQLGRNIFVNPNTGAVTLKAAPEEPEQDTEEPVVEPEIGEFQGGKLKNLHTASTGKMSLNNKTFSAIVQFDGTDSELRVGGSGSNIWSGIRFRRVNDSYFAFGNTFDKAETLIRVEEVGLNSSSDKFNLKIDFKYVALDTDKVANDVQYGIWIDGFLVNQSYFYCKDNADKFGVYVLIYCPHELGKVAVSTEEHQKPDDNTPYILEDFDVKDQVYSVDNLLGRSYTKELDATVTGSTSISGKVALKGDASMTLYGAPNNEWYGLRFRMGTDGLMIQQTESNVDSISISVPDVEAGETFTFSVEQNIVDLDSDGEQDDVRFGVRVNGTLCQQQRFFLLDFAGRTEAKVLLYAGTKDANTSWIDVKPSVSVESYDLDATDNGYLVSGKGTVTVNNAEAANGTILDTPGDYIIRCAQKGAYVKQVALYRSGDAHADGQSDARDLVAAVKAQSKVQIDTHAGRKAVDVDNNNVVNQVDYESIRNNLLGIANTIEKSVYLTHEENVMPIAGFYAPSRGTVDLITDDVYKLISEAGINLILSGNIDYRTKPQDVLDSLSLAEKYNLGMYVYDSRYNPASAVLLASELAEYQKDFAKYSSYKGTFVVDEPFTAASGRTEAGKMMSEYVYKTQMLNSYSNTLGYINIGPKSDYSSWGTLENSYRTNYTKHLDEILAPGAKLISWDYYVFDDITDTQAYASAGGYFANLNMMRERSLNDDRPFWGYIQAGSYWTNTVTSNKSTPSEAELLWNVNTSLAYGVKGIQYFTMVQPSEFASGSYEKNSLIDVNGNKTKWYGYAQTANKQIAAVDEYLLYANTLDVLAIGSTAQNHTGISKTTYGNVLTGVTASGGAVVGVFDYQGKTALYVVNYDAYDTDSTDLYSGGDVAADDITLTFGSSTNYQIISTQLASGTTSGSGTTCTLSLNNGGAALVILN